MPCDKDGYTTISLGACSKIDRKIEVFKESKKRKLQPDEQFEDLSSETVAEIIATIDDPNHMTGPDV